MSKMRVYEYAKKYNVSSKDVISKLKQLNIEVSNHMATIEDDTVKKLDSMFTGNSKAQGNNPAEKNSNQKQSTAKVEDSPNKDKVKSAPKNREGKKHDQQSQSKEKKVFNNNNQNNKKK
jgi:translation initiation factor IF-2